MTRPEAAAQEAPGPGPPTDKEAPVVLGFGQDPGLDAAQAAAFLQSKTSRRSRPFEDRHGDPQCLEQNDNLKAT